MVIGHERQVFIGQPEGIATKVLSDLGDWGAIEIGDDWEARPGTHILYTPRARRQGFCRENAVSR